MTRVLVTGLSGTGKSTVLGELRRRGHRVVDTDYGGWSEDVTSPDGAQPRLHIVEVLIEALALARVLPERVGAPCCDAFEEDVDRHAQQDDGIETVVELSLVRDAP